MSEAEHPTCHSQSQIRAAAKLARANMTPVQRLSASRVIAHRIIACDFFRNADSIACYIPLITEVDTWPIIDCAWKSKKRVFAPVVQKSAALQFRQVQSRNELSANKMGLLEPESGEFISASALDLVLTPVVAFDSERNRIGMGGGYYDRSFSFLRDEGQSFNPLLIGIAFECQFVEKITPNPWDIPLFRIVTQSSVR